MLLQADRAYDLMRLNNQTGAGLAPIRANLIALLW